MSSLNKNLEGSLKRRSVMFKMGRDQRSVGALARSWKSFRPAKEWATPPLNPREARLRAIFDGRVPAASNRCRNTQPEQSSEFDLEN